MGLKAKPPTEREYWEGVSDGIAEVAEQIGGMIRDGIAQAEAGHQPISEDLDLIHRQPVVKFLQGLARRLDTISAQTDRIINKEE